MKPEAFVICIDNSDYPASLERRKLYRVLADDPAREAGYIRVVDESGEDYLYPSSCFISADLSPEASKVLSRAES